MSIRAAQAEDDVFVLSLVDRFTGFPLPAGRTREEIGRGIRADLEKHLRARPATSHFFVIEHEGATAGFIHLQRAEDFFSDAWHCHISDLAIAPGHEGNGLASCLLAHAETFAREHECSRLTLSVFPGNERARALYERHGFGIDLLRMGKPI
ncbi:GNAT family N-acetyltransferase [Cognatilysobacter bugurensis]|uniref:N-acetyltransferase domain-containing protein n=1 Tax=Cognatilysobacter bugurensis TaxID=543356 RepID=A0A918SWV8_9GAMM|nr:GNAT family N-acetyltransferase [Lysobacter bugurensis]GHA76113.1 hypothetical protein GCM10007067_11660 [Lysobacter bugurensis]